MTKRSIIIRSSLAFILVMILSATVLAEPIRPLFSKENMFPERGGAEVGMVYDYTEFREESEQGGGEEHVFTPYVRYGLTENLAGFVRMPYIDFKPSLLSDERGVGDISVGLELVAYEDIFDYPWVIPHVEVFLPTGDDDKGLGRGDSEIVGGIAVGTTVACVYHYILDGRYSIISGEENVASLSGAFIWDLSARFSFIAEGRITNENRNEEDDDNPIFYRGGMWYQVNRRLGWGVYAGGGKNSDEDLAISGKVALQF